MTGSIILDGVELAHSLATQTGPFLLCAKGHCPEQ